ncbi:uncharacterized protein FA14DRAFT_190981 [Meira miltonrushii]|uniref:PH domain-containing protein n=1 Tax=Meira miltonrushii TaxID=1280837 RepID=A0A316V9X7_9BASI|nr:uncharacterized protein FA14DRAFT_190981 [Meira miltonrushii]PWN33868.1 hypothetical protein FA14DRAFT_190981 [Meira miltonrushii]
MSSRYASMDGSTSPLSSKSAAASGLLNMRRPLASGRKSIASLRQQASKGSIRSTLDYGPSDGNQEDSDYEGESTFDAPETTMSNPEPEQITQTLATYMNYADKGASAVGELGQTLLVQQSRMRDLLERVQGRESARLVEETQREIEEMRYDQQRLMMELLQSSNIDMRELLGPFGPQQSSTPNRPSPQKRKGNEQGLIENKVLVNDLHTHLANEIRRLQILIAERDKALVNMTEAAEEAVRIRSILETSVKRLETEKDAQDATLYEVERKEELLREENDEITRQLKKHENELRVLKRHLSEKTDAAETFKASNEELEQKVDDLRGNVATLRAKSVADQKTISGLKVEVNDLELKHRQAVEKIPQSVSIASRLSQALDSTGDATQIAGMGGLGPDSPSRARGAHDKALTPTASVDDDLASRLRPNLAVKNMEAEMTKWRNAAMKYRKKFNDMRKQGVSEGKAFEHDDSTDEEDEELWQDENVAPGSKRSANRSRIVSSSSINKKGKSMGDAFGFGRNKRASWQSQQDLVENSFDDDDASSVAESSVRGSIDGFDPQFADPTIRSGGNTKRRSTYTPSSLAKASPLSRTMELVEDGKSEAGDSFMSHGRSASINQQRGVLGDELMGLGDQEERIVESEHQAILEQSLAERDSHHEQHVQEVQSQHQNVLRQITNEHTERIAALESNHKEALTKALSDKEVVHNEHIEVIQNEHMNALAQQKTEHARALEVANKRYADTLSSRDLEHEKQVVEKDSQHESKIKDIQSRLTKTHENSMKDARERHAETLSKQREEAHEALLAAQREHKHLLEEHTRVHADTLKRKEAQHERELRSREKEHHELLEDVHATHESFIKQRDAAYNDHIAKRDEIIKERDQELSNAQSRIHHLEDELSSMKHTISELEAKVSRLSSELEDLHAQEHLRTLPVEAENEVSREIPSSSRSQISQDEFEDAIQGDETAKSPVKPKREAGSQTDSTESKEVNGEAAVHEDAPIAAKPVQDSKEVQTSLPPMPDMPPPPTLSSLLAKAARHNEQTSKKDMDPPSRPTSPPPGELVARSSQGNATRGSQVNTASGMAGIDGLPRPSSRLASGPPPSAYMQGAPRRSGPPSVRNRTMSNEGSGRHPMRAPSAQSFVSDATSDMMSGRTSRASNYTNGGLDSSYVRRGASGGGVAAGMIPGQGSTNPVVLGSITQTMIGDYLYKYTRRSMGRANKRHRRYFWVHPYTRTLYWTMTAPSEAVSTEVVNKSAFIQDVIVVEDENTQPPDLYHLSIVISTLTRDVKITARDKTQHDTWITALGYLVNKELPSERKQAPAEWRQSISRASLPRQSHKNNSALFGDSTSSRTPAGRRSVMGISGMSPSKSANAVQTLRTTSALGGESERTPRARGASVGGKGVNYPSLLHRRDTAAREYLEQWETEHGSSALMEDHDATPRAGATSSMSKRSARSGRGSLAREMFGNVRRNSAFSSSGAQTVDDGRFKSAEEMLAEDEERTGYDGLDNVRACCDGKHDIGKLSVKGHQHHHHPARPSSSGTGSVRSRISTPSLLRRSSRASKIAGKDAEARPEVPSLPPQLGQLNINNLSTDTNREGKLGATSNDWFPATSEFGTASGRATPASDVAPDVVVTDHNETITPSNHISFIDRVTQVRRNRASASIR